MKKIIISGVVIVVLIVLAGFAFDWGRGGNSEQNVTSTTSTSTSTSTSAHPYLDQIVVYTPVDNQVVTSPIKITGKARGTWYFEASFPVQLMDLSGNIIAAMPAQAQGDWMTTDFIDFKAELSYNNASSTGRAVLVIRNDNPSGEPSRDKYIYIPVILK